MKDLDRLIPIGRFAQLARLSLKALRIYDQLGLRRRPPRDLRYIEAQGGHPNGHGMVIYHGEVNDDSNGPVEVAVPVVRGSVQPAETLRLIDLPAGREAYTTITLAQSRFPEILKGYDAVAGWLKRNGHQMVGHPREIYFADDATTGPDDPYCDIAWPFT